MGKIISVLNEKGGVAKTTTVKNLACCLAGRGKKVLAVDLDSSANLTRSLDLHPTEETGSIVEIIDSMLHFEKQIPENYGIMHFGEGIDVIPSDMRLLQWTERIRESFRREEVLERYLDGIRDLYDYIFIDCPGGLELLTQNAMFASDHILIPTEATKLSIDAMQNIFVTLNLVHQAKRVESPTILGILFCLVRMNTVNNRMIMSYAREKYDDVVRVFEHFIPLSTTVNESDVAFKSVMAYQPKSPAAVQYQGFADEFLTILEGGE